MIHPESEPFRAERVLRAIYTKKSVFWENLRERKALALFHNAARKVPAYKDFLKKNRVNHEKIKTFKDFQLVPPVSKKNYLTQYPLEKITWDRSLHAPLVWTATSGSTGEPFYFPRNNLLDEHYSVIIESFLKNNTTFVKEPTLVVIAFGMGVWIGGILTYKAYEIAAQRGGYPVSILTPGINKKEIFNALRKLAPHFSQTILIGYPPFIKDILDEAGNEGVDLKKLNLRLAFAAEAFTENFRDYLAHIGGMKDVCLNTMNIYGSADIGAMAFETPGSIFIRRLAMKKKPLFEKLFGAISKTPTLAQYNPFAITFEAPDGEVLLTGDNTVPLVRYAIGDHGGVHSFSDVAAALREEGIDARRETTKAKIPLYELPFVHVYERKDLSTTLYGLQIYPETIKDVFLRKPLSSFLTGRFTLITRFDKRQNQFLEINIELKKNFRLIPNYYDVVLKKITAVLREKNSEYRELSGHLGKRALPKLTFWPNGHPDHFQPGTKQKWVKK